MELTFLTFLLDALSAWTCQHLCFQVTLKAHVVPFSRHFFNFFPLISYEMYALHEGFQIVQFLAGLMLQVRRGSEILPLQGVFLKLTEVSLDLALQVGRMCELFAASLLWIPDVCSL